MDSASQQLLLICGENPTVLNIRYDITLIKLTLNPSDAETIITRELSLLRLVNQKYRKSAKSWSYR